ncbi:hypothetical protein [Intestinibacillus sp. Marseille-P6563]|uniref:hypothetical protein n=1 Tax=Intestinibacillus sp. Marseille-P6563 TaxID=2364792 RepID=UPI000F0481FD|nr:hypothetical protein [Intestinibacillus sp. Marseille-P6563]
MNKYKLWDKKSDIYTPGRDKDTGKNHFTAEEWLERYAWAQNPDAKMIISNSVINGSVAMEFNATVEHYKRIGCDFSQCQSDDDYLQAISDFEDNPPFANEPTNEERIAAALEAQVMMALPASEATPQVMAMTMTSETISAETELSSAAIRVQKNYTRGLWTKSLVDIAVQKGDITLAERDKILNG